MPGSGSKSARAKLYVWIARISARLPAFRGRTRIFLELFRLLRLQNDHVIVQTRLQRPTVIDVELDLSSWLQRVCFLTGGYDADTTAFLVSLHEACAEPGFLLDIGANVGLIAIPFARMVNGTTPCVVAVEAVPDNVMAVRRNVELNGLGESVTIVPYALGERQKSGFIQVEGDLHRGEGTGTANILPDDSTYDCVKWEVRVETLDGLIAARLIPAGCAVIKIDTDGYDLKVLQGGGDFLERERPVIFGEFASHCMAWHGQSIADVIEFAQAHNYDVWHRTQPGWRFAATFDVASVIQDLLLVPLERRSKFEHFLA